MGILEKETQRSHNFSPQQTFPQKFQACIALSIKEINFREEKWAFSISSRKLALFQYFTNILTKKFIAAPVPVGFSYFCCPLSGGQWQ
ncbi:MAG TPA: hypothetical protein PK228_11860 [Saprospiraceae bacterium]|nr:hypothetical protein [Saprospiraceae bacterium]